MAIVFLHKYSPVEYKKKVELFKGGGGKYLCKTRAPRVN